MITSLGSLLVLEVKLSVSHVLRHSLRNPLMAESLFWSHSLTWIPSQNTFKELQEQFLFGRNDLVQLSTKAIRQLDSLHFGREAEILIEKLTSPFGSSKH